jgi:hypothetical protein
MLPLIGEGHRVFAEGFFAGEVDMFGAEEALGIHIVIEFKPLGEGGEGVAALGGVVVENDQQFLIGKLCPQDFRIGRQCSYCVRFLAFS